MSVYVSPVVAEETPESRPEAPAARPERLAEPQEVQVGVYVLSLGKLDISSGSFAADFYLSLKSKTDIPDNSFEFLNGRATGVDKIEDKGNEKFYRIIA